MDRAGRLLVLILSIPLIGIIFMSGFIGMRISDTWTESNTAQMVTGITGACSNGFLALVLIIGLIVGIPLALRLMTESAISRRAWDNTEGNRMKIINGTAQHAGGAPRLTTSYPANGYQQPNAANDWRYRAIHGNDPSFDSLPPQMRNDPRQWGIIEDAPTHNGMQPGLRHGSQAQYDFWEGDDADSDPHIIG